ncbi:MULTISPECIES: hypothetical protein [unclassified Streptomyces]|uniref:hypothetical protein n=1 Tax=unclassified Streptomyces TaxID=2593676 RepID=UPI0009BE2338|nr:hypothetical protein [Streptomyces sp. M41(2017)]OQQ19674.1 hypothetical protein B0675_23295 [Streptomyces sp. M41(2017)]
MGLRKRGIAAVFVAAAAFTAVGPRAVAVPMPWETSRVPAVAPQGDRPTAGADGTDRVTPLCGPPCYQ